MQLNPNTLLQSSHDESFGSILRLKSIVDKSQRIFNQELHKSFDVFLEVLKEDKTGLAAAVITKINESNKKQAERLALIVKSFERYKGSSFKDLILATSCEQLDGVSKKLHELEATNLDFDNFTESLSLLPTEVRQLVITSFLNNKYSNKSFISYQIESLQKQVVNTVGIKQQYDAALQKVARNSALGKKRSGADHISSVAKHTPFCKVLSLLSVLSQHSQIVLDNSNAVSVKKSINTIGDFFGRNYSSSLSSEKFNLIYVNCIEITAGLFSAYPNNHEEIYSTIVLICDHSKRNVKDDSSDHALYENIIHLEQSLYRWYEFQEFPRLVYGKTMCSLAGEQKSLDSALDIVDFLKSANFSNDEIYQIENVIEKLSSVPEQRQGQSDVRKVSDHLESWVAATVRTLNRNGMQSPDFQEWLFGKQTGLAPFLKAYGYRPQAERLSEIFSHLYQFYLCTAHSKDQADVKSTGYDKFDESSFWMKSGWYSRRVLNVMASLLKTEGAEESKRIVRSIDTSAKSFFKIFKEAKITNSSKRSTPTQSELDDAEKRYSQAIKSLSRNPSSVDIALSHIAAVLSANTPKSATFNQFRSLLLTTVGRFDRLVGAATTNSDKSLISHFVRSEIEKNYSLNNLSPILAMADNGHLSIAYNAIDIFLVPRTQSKPNTILTQQDVLVALECSELLSEKFGSSSEFNQIKELIRSISSKHDYKQSLQLLSAIFQTYTDQKDTKYLLQLLSFANSTTIPATLTLISNNCSKILSLQKSLNGFKSEEVQQILGQVLSLEIIDSRSVKEISDFGSKLSGVIAGNYDFSTVISELKIIGKYQKSFSNINIQEVANLWIDAYPNEHANNILHNLTSILESFNRHSDYDISPDVLTVLPTLLSIQDVESFAKWLSTLSKKVATEQIDYIVCNQALPNEWILLKRFGGYSQWQLLANEQLRKSVCRNPDTYLMQVRPISLKKSYSIEVYTAPSPFSPEIEHKNVFNDLLESIQIGIRNKPKNYSVPIEYVRSWCAEKIVDYRWRLVARRDRNDRAQLVVELINGLCTFPQKNSIKEQIIQATVKLAPVWSLEQLNKEALASLSKQELLEKFENFGLFIHDALIDDILDYAIKISSGKSLAYFNRNRSQFDLVQEDIDQLAENFISASGQNKSRKLPSYDQSLSRQEPSNVGFTDQLSRAYLASNPGVTESNKGAMSSFSGPSESEILNIQLKRRIELSQSREQDADKSLTHQDALMLIANSLRLIVSREKRDLEQIAKLIEDTLPLFLYPVREARFPAVVAKFIYQQLPELLDINSDNNDSRFGRNPCGLTLNLDTIGSQKDRDFLSKLQNILAEKVGITNIYGDQNSSQNSCNSLTSDIDQKISEIMYSYWFHGFQELQKIDDIVLETLEELKPSSLGYSTVITSMLGSILQEQHPHYERVLKQAAHSADIPSIAYVKSVGTYFINKLKRDLQTSEVYHQEGFSSGVKKFRDALSAIDSQMSSMPHSTPTKFVVNIDVSELTDEIKTEFIEVVESDTTTHRQKKSSKSPRVFLVSDKDSGNPLFVATLYKKSDASIRCTVPMLLGKNRKILSELISELSEQ